MKGQTLNVILQTLKTFSTKYEKSNELVDTQSIPTQI